ncbi:MAG: hypothetical protein EOO73_02850 [Myxococcales bacterium]|nr:MAG: hypothetical protein EOO73_02850 [Myxococcales bacterium]
MRKEWWRGLREIYLTVDPRSLGAFRIALALVLLLDLARRWAELPFWYVNSGLLPNHTLLWRPPAKHLFSLFFGVSTAPEARVFFALCAVVYLFFLVGYRTAWVQVLVLVARVSLNTRLAVLENGGDMVMNLLCLLTLPLPLGTRFSLDAVALARQEQRAAGVEGPLPHFVPERSRRPIVSLAVLGLLLQFGFIYFFNAASKNGSAWKDGTAVHFALHQDKLVTWAGVWMREHLPPLALRGLTHGVLVTEWVGFALILTPFNWKQARLLAVCVLPLLHLGFALGLNLGGFSPAMMAFYPLLITASGWDALEARFGARAARGWARVEARGSRWLDALRSPGEWPWPELRLTLWNSATALVLVAIASEVLNDNSPVPKPLRLPQPTWAKAVIEYPRVLQGWRMFASEPSRTDSMIYVDATTAAGDHVDPYNDVASDQKSPMGNVVPRHMGQSQFFVMFSDRIASDYFASYRQAFAEWLLAYPERTGRPRDCLLSYHVYVVTDRSPEPGSNAAPSPVEKQRFMTYNAPSDSPCRELKKAPSSTSAVTSAL